MTTEASTASLPSTDLHADYTNVQSALSSHRAVVVDIVSDLVCPWCWVTKRNLEIAITQLSSSDRTIDVVVRWHPFQLRSDMPPPQGMPKTESKHGVVVDDRLRKAGEAVGIHFSGAAVLLGCASVLGACHK
eukprot:scaffold51692_cov35-Prasinocladus_malaysianus.AAC.2